MVQSKKWDVSFFSTLESFTAFGSTCPKKWRVFFRSKIIKNSDRKIFVDGRRWLVPAVNLPGRMGKHPGTPTLILWNTGGPLTSTGPKKPKGDFYRQKMDQTQRFLQFVKQILGCEMSKVFFLNNLDLYMMLGENFPKFSLKLWWKMVSYRGIESVKISPTKQIPDQSQNQNWSTFRTWMDMIYDLLFDKKGVLPMACRYPQRCWRFL